MKTAQQIAEQLERPDIASGSVLELRDAIAHRRTTLNARLAEIEPERRSSFDPAAHVALNEESELLDVELGLLAELDSRSFKVHESALDREAPGIARDAIKSLPKLLKRALAAKAEHEQGKRELHELLERLCGAHSRTRSTGPAVDDDTFEQIAAVLFESQPFTADQLAGGRRLLRCTLIGPEPVRYANDPPDFRELARVSQFGRRDP